MNIFEVKNLYKSYPQPGNIKESFKAVDGITFNIEVGEVYGILGPNGAGKTTTLEMLEGLNVIDSGSALIDGLDVSSNAFKVKEIIGVDTLAYLSHNGTVKSAPEDSGNYCTACFSGEYPIEMKGKNDQEVSTASSCP